MTLILTNYRWNKTVGPNKMLRNSAGLTARFTHNQNIVYPQMAEGLPIPTARAGDNIASLLATQNPVHSTSFSFMGQRMTSIWGNGAINNYYFLVIRF